MIFIKSALSGSIGTLRNGLLDEDSTAISSDNDFLENLCCCCCLGDLLYELDSLVVCWFGVVCFELLEWAEFDGSVLVQLSSNIIFKLLCIELVDALEVNR